MVDALAEKGFTKDEIIKLGNKGGKGRKPEAIVNPFYQDITEESCSSLDEKEEPTYIQDAIYGVCNSFDSDNNGKAKRIVISPRKLSLVLKMPVITTKGVKGVLSVGDVQARRYIKAAKILITVLGNK